MCFFIYHSDLLVTLQSRYPLREKPLKTRRRIACEEVLLGRSGGGAKKERGLKGFKPIKVSRLLACKQALPREHNVIACLKINQSAFRIPFWDADIQFYEMRVQTLLLFSLSHPRTPGNPRRACSQARRRK